MPDFICSVFTAVLVELANTSGKTTGRQLVNFLKQHRISIFRKHLVSYFYDGIYHGFVAI